jgi:hypothetical protein
MTGNVFTLDDFRRGDAKPAKNLSAEFERYVQSHLPAAERYPPITLADPSPKAWGEFWRADDFWSRRQATDIGPSPESWRQVSTYPER